MDGFNTYEKQDRVLVGMSGGVDSSVTVRILQEQGFAVEGAVIRFSPVHEAAVAEAKAAAKTLGIRVHVVDAASTEGRDPVEDIRAINRELEKYDPALLARPQVIAANKIDAIYPDGEDPVQKLREAFDVPVFPISAVSGQGVRELLYHVYGMLRNMDQEPTVFEPEFDLSQLSPGIQLPFEVEKMEEGLYRVEGPRIEKMLGYTNIDSEKGFEFFQNFLKKNGILEELEKAGIQEGDTVKMYGLEFDYYK